MCSSRSKRRASGTTIIERPKAEGESQNDNAALGFFSSTFAFCILTSDFSPWLPALLQTSDSLFPTGAYAHSGGLETLVELGVVRDAPSLSAFLREHVVPGLARFELPYLRFAWVAAQTGEIGELAALDREYGAARLPRESREASAHIGAQRLRTLLRVMPETLIGGRAVAAAFHGCIERGEAAGHAAIVCGVQASWLAVPCEGAGAAYFYGSVSGYCSAALKLIRIGQEGCQTVLADVLTLADATVRASGEVSREDAGWCDPLWEIAAARHERAFARLFIS